MCPVACSATRCHEDTPKPRCVSSLSSKQGPPSPPRTLPQGLSRSSLSQPLGTAPGEALGFLPWGLGTIMRFPEKRLWGPFSMGLACPSPVGHSATPPLPLGPAGKNGSEGPHSRGLVTWASRQVTPPMPGLPDPGYFCPSSPLLGAGYVSQSPPRSKANSWGWVPAYGWHSRAGQSRQLDSSCDRGPAGLT